MSYTDDFWNALEEEQKKKKKKKGNTTVTQSSGDSYTDEFFNELQSLEKKSAEVDNSFLPIRGRFDDEDIAPVKEEDDSLLDFFDAGALKSWGDGKVDWDDVSALPKAILGTAGDAVTGVAKGVFGFAEGIADTLGYGIYGLRKAFGENEASLAQYKRDIASSTTDKVFGGAEDYLDQYSVLGRTSNAVTQGVGQAGTMLATGGFLGGAAGLGSVGTSLVTNGILGVSSLGSGMSEAYTGGATDGEALGYGAMSAGSEILFESLFGGMGKAVNAVGFNKGVLPLDDMAAKAVSKFVKGQTGKNIVEGLVKGGFEGLEELGTGFAQAGAKKLTYMSEEDFGKILEDENLFEQFIVGALTSDITQAPDVNNAIKSGRDFVTGNTQNEQSVIDKVVEDRIAEEEKNGKKLSGREKNKILDEVVRDMERGYIPTDTIEEVLGGDSYKSYKDTVAKEDAIKKEFEELKGKQNATLEEQARFREVRREYYRLQSEQGKSRLTDQKNKLSQDVFNMVKNDRLAESYLEKSRVGEDFQADLTKYKGAKHEDAAKQTIENAIKAGANNTNRVHDLVDMAAELSSETGYVYDFKDNEQIKNDFIERKTNEIAKLEAVENRTDAQNEKIAKLKDLVAKVQNNEVTVNGNVDSKGIVLNLDSAKPLNRIIGHEITHTVEKAKHYDKLRDSLFAYAKSKGVDIDAELEMKALEYEGVEGTTAEAELVADLVGDYLFTDSDFVRNLSTENRNLAQRIYDEIKYFLTKATQGSKEERELVRVKHEFEKAFRETAEVSELSDSDVKHSLRTNPPPKETGVAYKVFFVKDGKLYPPMVANPDGADTPMGVWLDADVGTSAPPSKTGRQQVKAGGKGTQGGGGSLAFRPGWHLGDLPRASQFDRVNPETGNKELFPENFVWAEVEYAKDVDYQEEAMSYGYTDKGKFRHAYAGLPRLPENGYYRYRTNPKPDTVPWIITGAMKVNRLLSDAEVNQILEQNGVAPVHRQGGDVGLDKFGFDESGAVKYSLSKGNQGKTLYTGSPVTDIKQFKVGGANGARQTGDRYGRGIYLTTNKGTAQGYAGDSGRVYEINADDLNIFDLNEPITEEMKATLARELNGKDKQFRNSILRNFRSEKAFTDFDSAEKFFDEQRKVWKEEDGYYSANKPEILGADDKTGKAVIEYTDFVNIDNAIGNLTGNQLYDALKSISTDDFASFITGHGFDGISFDEDSNNQQYVIYRSEDRLRIMNDGDVAPTKYSLSDNTYLDAVNRGDTETAQKMVDEAAKNAGYTPEHLYHGTSGFGFTKIDTNQSDDGISFFVADKVEVAQGYFPYFEDESDEYHDSVRAIGKASDKPNSPLYTSMGVDEVVARVKEAMPEKYGNAKPATEEEVISYLNKTWIPKTVSAATDLKNYSIPKNVESLVDSVIEANFEGTYEAWKAVADRYKEFADIYDIYYNGQYFPQASMLWLNVQSGIQMANKAIKPDAVYNNGEIIGKNVLVERYNDFLAGEANGVYDLYANHDNQLVIRGRGSNWNDLPLGEATKDFNDWWVNEEGYEPSVSGLWYRADTRSIAKYAKARGYRSVRFEDIHDAGAYGDHSEISTVYAFFNPDEDIKSADAVTYDDNDNVIPLSQRFNAKNDDIRYSLSDSDGKQLSKEQQTFFKDSKARDENGNLLVMYHGSQRLGFTVFDPNASDDNKSFFFSDKPSVAASYSNTEDEIAPYVGDKSSGLYKTYLNLTNPYIVDARGSKWNNVVEFTEGDEFLSDIGAYMGIIRTMDSSLGIEDFLDSVRGDLVGSTDYAIDELFIDEDTEESHFTAEEQQNLRELAERIQNTYNEWDEDAHIDEDGESTDFESYVRQNYTSKTTRQIANEAYKNGYDGVIFKNIVDVGKFGNMAQQNYDKSTVAVAFDSSQIKSVDNETPTSDPDIRLSLSKRGEEFAPIGKNDFYGKDFRKKSSDEHPVADDVNPSVENVEADIGVGDAHPIADVDATTNPLADFNDRVKEIAEHLKNGETIDGYNILDTHYSTADDSVRFTLTMPSGKKVEESASWNPAGSGSELYDAVARLIAEDKYGRPSANVKADTNVGRGNVMDAHPVAETADVESLAGDRDSFMSQKAMELYKEITSLKKGVRASQRLGYLLDHGHEWRSIKTALLNIRDNPNQVVNPNSAAESVAREMLGREYDAMVSELAEPSDVAGKIRNKMQHIQTEIANNERLREQSNMDYDSEIAEVQAEYDAKKNKNTIVANDLLRRIERLNRMKNTNDDRYSKRIGDLEARLEKMRQPTYKRAVQRREKHDEYTNLMKNLVGDTTHWVDKKLGISYKVNTLRRNLRDVVRDAKGNRDIAKADAIYDELQGKYNHNEAELKRESRRIKKVFADLNLNHAEDIYAHMLGEFRHNPDSKLTEESVKEFYEENKGKIDTKKVDKAIEESRKTFDELIVRVNERLKEQGMKEIPYRQGYFPHFTNPKQGWLAKLFNWKTVDTEIPTSIAGLTETFNPERSWQGFSKQRKGDTTDYSLEQGLDTYIHGALDWIYHIEDIQKRRALENHIRYIHSEEGVKARVDAINKSEELDADEAQRQIDAVYAEANNPLNNFVTNLRAGTNTLANKKSENDRQWETNTNRKIYSVMTNLNNRINANMVVGSLSSALTNFIPITQSWMEVSPVYSLRGMKDTIKSTIRDDGIVNKSDFLTNRLMNEENLYQTTWDKISDKAAIMMEAIDSFTSQTVWRSKYLQNISEGMSETEAIKNADQFAENVIAGRSRGNQPTLFDAKNPFTKMFTAFQLEVSNQYGYMFKDVPQDSKNKARLIKGYATAFLGAYAYNALYSSLVGRDAAFDPISILEDLFRDMGLFGDDDEEEPEDIILNLTGNILEEVPFVGGLIGGGRIPISSAIPYGGDYKTIISNIANGEGSTKEWLKPVYYLALPVGGGQIKKTNEGLGMFSDDHPVAGSYTDSGNLRFPVDDTFGNRLQAGLFGQYASENARDYFDNGRSPLKEKQIQEYIDVDIPIRDYWDYREGLADQKTIEDKFDYIAGLDLPVSKKNILINNVVDREESVDLEGYEDFSSYDEFDFATKKPGEYAVSQVVGGYDAYVSYMDAIGDITADKDENGKSISGSKKEKVVNYIESLDIDYGMKIILFKSMYDSKEDRNTYNADIVEYLDSREDISYDEMVTILTELGMRVEGNNVYWD